ncbi:hypothetical protein D9619_011549 [Psilocybe cf. subviscida]|uniref:NACHT domain-containing protein n=1 Tax=Psilocybe cf. subviscida TaxID=2480587 RepID=A0A8H5BT71_9AGAR|nr:hypothetical protein D9619_011549 [Psilocybe cf. subviscida]
MKPFGSSSSSPVECASKSSKDSNRWTTIKPSLVLGLKATEMALDGLPIPGAKGCISLILYFLETADLAAGNAEALEALQRRLKSLQGVLSPLYAKKGVNVPDDVRKDVGELAANLDALAAQWKRKLEKKRKKRHLIRQFINAKDDRELLTLFANAIDRVIQDFLVSIPVEPPKPVQSTYTRTTKGHHNYEWTDKYTFFPLDRYWAIYHAHIDMLLPKSSEQIAAFKEDMKNREVRMLDRLPRAPTASYNSIRTGGANACMNGTRVSILNTIRAWARNPDPNQPPMFWLNGLAGIGKTTIAHTIASELDADGRLGASFVFLRADDQLKDARLVFPTLAFQLAQFSSDFKTGLVEVLEYDPDCGSKRLDLQFASLVLQPFSTMSLSAPVVLILDALDECDPEGLTSELLWILHRNIKRVPFLRVFVTSRPEGYICKALDLVDSSSPHQKLVLHEDIHAEEVENDIRLFLQSRLQEIWDERMNQTSICWPCEGDLEKLVNQSGRLFIYAATAVRFIGGNSALSLNRQLSTLLRVKLGHVPNGEPYRQLDGLYLQILHSVFPDSDDEYYIQRFRRIVGSIVFLERPLPLESLANLLVDYSVEEIMESLYHLHSILIVPAVSSEAPRTYHLSFPNFITNSNRCTNPKPYIDPGQQAKYLFDRCLAIMENDFGPILDSSPNEDIQDAHQVQVANIARQQTPIEEEFLTDSDSDDDTEDHDSDERSARTHISLEDDSEDHNLAPEIRYSNNYWCRHLMNVPTGNQEAALSLEHFITQYLPQWLQRRISRILDDSGNTNIRLAGDTFDIIHNAYRWGLKSGCSNQFQALLQRRAKRLFAQLFPNTHVHYSFGRRFNAQDLDIMSGTVSNTYDDLVFAPAYLSMGDIDSEYDGNSFQPTDINFERDFGQWFRAGTEAGA